MEGWVVSLLVLALSWIESKRAKYYWSLLQVTEEQNELLMKNNEILKQRIIVLEMTIDLAKQRVK